MVSARGGRNLLTGRGNFHPAGNTRTGHASTELHNQGPRRKDGQRDHFPAVQERGDARHDGVRSSGQPVGLKWRVDSPRGDLSFALPINPEAVYRVLTAERILVTNDQAPWVGRDGGERTQQETLADRGGASLRGRWVSCRLAVRPGVEWLAAGPWRDAHCPPMANPPEDAG